MFGYIRIAKPELKVREYELYKAVYCTLCKRLGKNYGLLSRLTLSYDFTFLALLKMSMTDGCDNFHQKRCAFNPLKKCNYCDNDIATEMPAAAAMIMLYYKIKDNIADEKGFKKLFYLLLKPVFSGARKKAKMRYPEIEDIVKRLMDKQFLLEKNGCKNIDEACDPTATALSEILMLCSNDTNQKRVLSRLGYCLGRYIYMLDAACDLEEDKIKNRYNVLNRKEISDTNEYIKSEIYPKLYFCINEASKAFELLDIKKYKNILGNIIYLGLEDTFKKELSK